LNLNTTLVIIAALCWGLSGGIGGILMDDGWNAFVVSLYRGGIGLLFVSVWLALKPKGNGLATRRLWKWSMLAGLGVAGNFAFYFLSIAEGSVAVAATLMYCAPVFVYLISFILKLEKQTPAKWMAMVMVLIGIGLLTQIYKVGAGNVTLVAAGAGLLSGLSYAAFIFGFKYAAPHGSPQAILVVTFIIVVLTLSLLSNTSQTYAVLQSARLPLFITLGVLGAGLSFVFYITGLNYTAPAVASILAMVEPVTASLFGVVVLNEPLTTIQVFGMALILLTVTGLSVYSSRRKRQPV
jgi:drug/metabolite transporter, DME family